MRRGPHQGCCRRNSQIQHPEVDRSQVDFARFFFIAPSNTGVIEVSANPPSICYSTQSSPATAIVIVKRPGDSPFPVAAYAPESGTFCDRTVSERLAWHLISDPSAYAVKWTPRPGEPEFLSTLTTGGSPSMPGVAPG